MFDTDITTIIDTIGFLTGVFGVSMVVYLLMISRKQYDHGRLWTLLIVGSALIVMNFQPFISQELVTELLRLIAYAVLFVLFARESYVLWDEAEPVSSAADALNGE
jgi:O-antigen/teichoic acid export membrane protein